MGNIKVFGHPEISLWQSVVDERESAAGAHDPAAERLDLRHPLLQAATRLGEWTGSEIGAAVLPNAPPVSFPVRLETTAVHEIAHLFNHFRATVRQAWTELGAGPAAFGRLRELLLTRYDAYDPRWIEATVEYAKYYLLYQAPVPYRRNHSLDDFVLDGSTLPPRARVALLGDWGTGQPEALHLLQQIASHQPHVLLHLGDIYYSGLASEIQRAFLGPCAQVLWPAVPGCAVYSLCGNHDLYSGGRPYYDLLDQLGQPASYFCVRNDYWQLLAIDTGLHGRYVPDRPTFLEESEREWLQDKIDRAGGRRNLLFSHHQLFTAYESIGGGPVNHRLQEQLAPLLPQLTCWFWGHEHNLVVFEEYLGCRARCLGHGAIPVPYGDLSPPPRYREIPLRDVHLGANRDFYHHGYAILDLDGPKAHVAYYQESDTARPLYEEDL
ncbi:MAG: metallophosphoesterase [Gemmataceae bacterium]|nr:metallophosphoesterase [Gemmataceae bacterium]